MQHKVQETMKKFHMLESVQTCYVALSGGADSVCLFHILNRYCGQRGIALKAAHVNHCLREHAEAEEYFVRKLAAEYEVPLVVEHVEVEAIAKEKKMGLEEAGRHARYDFFGRLLEAEPGSIIATAHTASDNAETVILNLCRGAGLRGLSGIPPVRTGYIRPLIACTKAEVDGYMEQHTLPHVEDESNQELHFRRNYVRHRIIPVLKKELAPHLEQRLLRQSLLLREENEFLDSSARAYMEYLPSAAGEVALHRKRLAEAPRVLLPRVAKLVAETHFHVFLDLGQSMFCAEQLVGGKNMLVQCLPRGLEMQITSEQVLFRKHHHAPEALVGQELHMGSNFVHGFGTITFKVIKNSQFGKKIVDKYGIDYGIIKGTDHTPVFVRSRCEGDRLCLPGRRTRTLKKMYIDAKIPVERRGGLPVLTKGDGICCAYPFGVDHKFAVTEYTREILKITFEEELQL